jgi:hypothetical protein
MNVQAKQPTAPRLREIEKPNPDVFNNAVAELRKKLRQPTFKEVVQRGTSDATFEFHFTDRPCIVIGNWHQSRSQQHVRGKFEEARIKLPRFPRTWPKVLDLIFDATKVIQTITEEEELRSLIIPFTTTHVGANFEQEDKQDVITYVEGRIRHRGCFYDRLTGVVYLKAERLVDYLNHQRIGRRYSQHDVVKLLQRHGFLWRQKGIRYRDADNKSCFHNFGRFWRSPEGYVIRDEERSEQPEEFTRPRKVIAASKHL